VKNQKLIDEKFKIKIQISLNVCIKRCRDLDDRIADNALKHPYDQNSMLVNDHEWNIINKKFDPESRKKMK